MLGQILLASALFFTPSAQQNANVHKLVCKRIENLAYVADEVVFSGNFAVEKVAYRSNAENAQRPVHKRYVMFKAADQTKHAKNRYAQHPEIGYEVRNPQSFFFFENKLTFLFLRHNISPVKIVCIMHCNAFAF